MFKLLYFTFYSLWHFEDSFSKLNRNIGFILPSDTFFRQDIIELQKSSPDYKLVQKIKKELANNDIKDSKLRKPKI